MPWDKSLGIPKEKFKNPPITVLTDTQFVRKVLFTAGVRNRGISKQFQGETATAPPCFITKKNISKQ